MKTSKNILQNIFSKPYSIFTGLSQDADEFPKTHLIYLFNFIALLFVVPLGLQAFFMQTYDIAYPLFTVAAAILFNYYFLKMKKNEEAAAHLLAIVFFILMLYLIYTGGINHTGPLWISSFPIIVFYLLDIKQGFIYTVIFIILSSIILFFPLDFLVIPDYSHDFSLRIILSFILITFLSSMYEYSNTKAFNNMQKLKEELEYSSSRDYLTSLYNRRGYERNIKNIKNVHGVILMCDIDHFKKINDNYGHDAGDFILQKVARKIKSILREDDIAVRWGGEEFFIFLPHTSCESACIVAEKIRITIEELILNYEGQNIVVTLSIGLEEVSPETTLEDAINNADNAMYQAKQAGRNTIASFCTS